ncbi:MAG: hypothetical protein JW820_15555 [Spirochaetales bacterium]|nr:hypothetical protein [Spirochaetales bacterium]
MRALPIILVVLLVAVAGTVVILVHGTGTETAPTIAGPPASGAAESPELVAVLRSLEQAVERLTARLDALERPGGKLGAVGQALCRGADPAFRHPVARTQRRG